MDNKKERFSRYSKPVGLVLLIVAVIVLTLGLKTALAAPVVQQERPPLQEVPMKNDECLDCHKAPEMVRELPSGEHLFLTVDQVAFETSIHGRLGYSCVQCHTNVTGYPHPELTVTTAREWTVQVMQACMNCHTKPAEDYAKGRHARAYLMGDTASATCIDCHSSHQTRELSSSHVAVAQTCETCHSEVYAIYKNSVHGQALLEEDNQDVPTCNDCHEDHANSGPSDSGYVLFSPQICAKCHADAELMGKYGINTDVFDTYVADFHGTTITLFENIAPDQETNKPVCVDCHGVHDIHKPDEVDSTVFKENIDATCQRCHPDATPEFNDAWLSHYRPDLDHNPIVYVVDLFYAFLIPGVIGGMFLFVSSQALRKWINKRKGTAHHSEGAE